MTITPIFPREDPDDEIYPCIFDDCESLVPLAGPDGIVRHLLARHPGEYVTRGVFAALVEVQLIRAEDAALLR